MEKDQKQPQGGQAQGGDKPQASPPPVKAQEAVKQQVVNRAKRYEDAEKKLAEKKVAAWATYYEKRQAAESEYNGVVRDIYEGERKAQLQASEKSEDNSPEQALQAYRSARLRSVHAVNEVNAKLRAAYQQHEQKLGSFWADVWGSIAEAVDEFWDWINDWWEEPPVEGNVAPLRASANPAWRAAVDPALAGYYAGWNYGAYLF